MVGTLGSLAEGALGSKWCNSSQLPLTPRSCATGVRSIEPK